MHTIKRTRGHQEALFVNGVPYNPQLTMTGDWERDSGFLLGEQLIRAGADAIFAHNDVMALGVLDYCNTQGIVVGKDLKLIGFDNREISLVCRPTLSTIALPLYEIGQKATHLLIKTLKGEHKPGTGEISLDCTIIERESTKDA
jgi:LacI family transcriptional regulator